MATVPQISAFFQSYNPSGGGVEEWNMWCQAGVSRIAKQFGSFVRDYESARAARLASGPLTTDFSKIKVGWVGYWLWNPDDHVAGMYAGNGFWIMGSRHITTAFGGVSRNMGIVSHGDFAARSGLTFLGAAPTNGGNVTGITEPALAANERRVIDDGYAANGRSGPSRSYPVIDSIPSGETGAFKAAAKGESVGGNEWWFQGAIDGAWFSATVFENAAPGSLPVMVWKDPVNPGTPAQPENPSNPGSLPYNFTPDFPEITQRVVAASRTNWEPGNFPARPDAVVIHQWDDPAVNPSLETVLGMFRNPRPAGKEVSPHFTIDAEGNIIQNVSLQDRAYHAGKGGNGWVGIECEPHMGPKTVAAIRLLLEALRDRNGGVPLRNVLHRDVPGASTSCGAAIVDHLPELDVTPPVQPEEPEQPTEPEGPDEPTDPEPGTDEPDPDPKPSVSLWVRLAAGAIVLIAGLLAAIFGH